MGGETGLYGGEMCTIGQALNGDDISALNLSSQREAGQFRNPVDHDRATTAGSKIAAALHTQRTHSVSQDIQEDGVAWSEHLKGTSVYRGSPALSLRGWNH